MNGAKFGRDVRINVGHAIAAAETTNVRRFDRVRVDVRMLSLADVDIRILERLTHVEGELSCSDSLRSDLTWRVRHLLR